MRNRILRHLIDYGSITTWEAIQEYGCTRLSEYIRQLRKDYTIKDEWVGYRNRYGEATHYKKYILGREN